MKIALGADSAGKPLIDVIEAHLKARGQHEVINMSQTGFYADLSAHVAKAVVVGSVTARFCLAALALEFALQPTKFRVFAPHSHMTLIPLSVLRNPIMPKSSPWVRGLLGLNWRRRLSICS